MNVSGLFFEHKAMQFCVMYMQVQEENLKILFVNYPPKQDLNLGPFVQTLMH